VGQGAKVRAVYYTFFFGKETKNINWEQVQLYITD